MGHSVNWMMSGSCLHHSFNFDQHLMTTSQGYYRSCFLPAFTFQTSIKPIADSVILGGEREREREIEREREREREREGERERKRKNARRQF